MVRQGALLPPFLALAGPFLRLSNMCRSVLLVFRSPQETTLSLSNMLVSGVQRFDPYDQLASPPPKNGQVGPGSSTTKGWTPSWEEGRIIMCQRRPQTVSSYVGRNCMNSDVSGDVGIF